MKALRVVLARLHAWTAPPRPRAVPPMRDPGALPPLRLVAVPGPAAEGPGDLLLVRGVDAFLVSYPELSLIESSIPRLRDGLARFSPHYAAAEVPPPAEPLH